MKKLLENLTTLVACPSFTRDRKTCKKLLKSVANQIPHPTLSKNRETIWWGHTNLSTTKWLINTHLDVVPCNIDQLSLTVAGDRAWGRGTADVKGCACILLNNAKVWDEVAKQKGITFMLVTDEEIGGGNTRKILNGMKSLCGAIFLEPTNLHITTEAKGMMQVRIKAQGRSCHGSRPWEGVSAIEQISRGLIQFRLNYPSPTKETRETTFNFSQISGGSAINQVADKAELWCDIRFNPKDEVITVIDKLSEHFGSCKIESIVSESPIICDRDTQIFNSIARSLKANDTNPLTQFGHGTSDARHATKLGIPAIVFGPKGAGLHSDREWVSLKSLLKVQNVLDHWIHNI